MSRVPIYSIITLTTPTLQGVQRLIVENVFVGHGLFIIDQYGNEYSVDGVVGNQVTLVYEKSGSYTQLTGTITYPKSNPVTSMTIPKPGDILTIDEETYKILSLEPDGYFRMQDVSNLFVGEQPNIRTVGFIVGSDGQLYIVDKPHVATMTIVTKPT